MSVSVLIVDDNDLNRELLTEVLHGGGYATAEAADGQKALDYLHGRTARPGLILLDMNMPVMDGWEFLRRKRKETLFASVPVIIFTATEGINVRTMQALGAADVLRKPAAPQEVLAAIGRHC